MASSAAERKGGCTNCKSRQGYVCSPFASLAKGHTPKIPLYLLFHFLSFYFT